MGYNGAPTNQERRSLAESHAEDIPKWSASYQIILHDYLWKVRDQINSLWIKYMDDLYSQYTPKAYGRTYALKLAFNVDQFVKEWKVTATSDGNLKFHLNYLFNTKAVMDEHNKVQGGNLHTTFVAINRSHSTPQSKSSMWDFLDSHNYADRKEHGDSPEGWADIAGTEPSGFRGSLHKQKASYFEDYFAAGANRGKSPMVYAKRGGTGTSRQHPPYMAIYNFFFALGLLTEKHMPHPGREWTIKIIGFTDAISYVGSQDSVVPALGGLLSAISRLHSAMLRSKRQKVGRSGSAKGSKFKTRGGQGSQRIPKNYSNIEYLSRRLNDIRLFRKWSKKNIALVRQIQAGEGRLLPGLVKENPAYAAIAQAKVAKLASINHALATATSIEDVAKQVTANPEEAKEAIDSLAAQMGSIKELKDVSFEQMRDLYPQFQMYLNGKLPENEIFIGMAKLTDLQDLEHGKLMEGNSEVDRFQRVPSNAHNPDAEESTDATIRRGDDEIFSDYIEGAYEGGAIIALGDVDIVTAICAKKEFGAFFKVKQEGTVWYLYQK